MKTIRFISLTLALLMTASTCLLLTVTAADQSKEYPELMITEIGVDQIGQADNVNNKNPKYKDAFRDRDPYEFIEIYNNSDKALNVYDYMLAYQGCYSSNANYFEKSIGQFTPFYPGSDWTDGPFTSYDSYWQNGETRPVNPEYKDGEIKAGEVFVAWIYTNDSHVLNCTLEQFKSYWKIDANIKVFIIDGGSASDKNFSLKNANSATYSIIHQSERFLKRRSFDETIDFEITNTHHNYEGKTYADLEEVISWSVVDFRSNPLKAQFDANTLPANFTISYLPYSASAQNANGYTAQSVSSLKRVHIQNINSYTDATVGKLNAAQTEAFKAAKTSVVRTEHDPVSVINEIKNRPSLIITELSSDQYVRIDKNINPDKTKSASADVYEFLEVYNNSAENVNIYDYMIGYQGSNSKAVSTYFERLVQEYTPIFPGSDWIDAPFTAYDKYWTDTSYKRPVNPAYSEGWLKPGEVAVIWVYSVDSLDVHATVEQFRAFWSVPENVKVFLLDGNSSLDKNFNIKNSGTGTYIIMKPCDKYPLRRGDDVTFNTEEGGGRLDVYYNLHDPNVPGGWTYETTPEIVSWAVVEYDYYDPLYTYVKNGAARNYTLEYAPYNGEKLFTNGFLTVSFASQKRMHLIGPDAKSNVGILTETQKAKIQSALPQ